MFFLNGHQSGLSSIFFAGLYRSAITLLFHGSPPERIITLSKNNNSFCVQLGVLVWRPVLDVSLMDNCGIIHFVGGCGWWHGRWRGCGIGQHASIDENLLRSQLLCLFIIHNLLQSLHSVYRRQELGRQRWPFWIILSKKSWYEMGS